MRLRSLGFMGGPHPRRPRAAPMHLAQAVRGIPVVPQRTPGVFLPEGVMPAPALLTWGHLRRDGMSAMRAVRVAGWAALR